MAISFSDNKNKVKVIPVPDVGPVTVENYKNLYDLYINTIHYHMDVRIKMLRTVENLIDKIDDMYDEDVDAKICHIIESFEYFSVRDMIKDDDGECGDYDSEV